MKFQNGLFILVAVLVGFGLRRFFIKRTGIQDKKRAVRLARIQQASAVVQIMAALGSLATVYAVTAFFLGWPFFNESHIRVVISPSHVYTAPADMSAAVLTWWLIKMAWSLLCCGALFALFRLYYQGIYFSTKNVWLIRALGFYLVGNFCIDSMLQGQVPDLNVNMTAGIAGILVNFVSWIMDEGRKIQEEQELTV